MKRQKTPRIQMPGMNDYFYQVAFKALVSLPVILFVALGKEHRRSRLFFSHIPTVCSYKERPSYIHR